MSSGVRTFVGQKKKIGFVCSGGATKAGAFHLGVALALRSKGFSFGNGTIKRGETPRTFDPMEISCYVGSSAGSVITTYLASGYSLENIFNSFVGKKPEDPLDAIPRSLPRLTYPMLFKLRPGLAREQLAQVALLRTIVASLMRGDVEALMQLKWLKTTGVFTTAGVEEFLREQVLPTNRFEEIAPELYIVSTQLNHSRKIVFGKNSFAPPGHDLSVGYNSEALISEACAASTSLPFIFSPFTIRNSDGEEVHYIDGELRDTLSTHVALDAGCDLVFASYTHQPYHYEKLTGSLMKHGLPAILVQSAYLVIEQKIRQHVHYKTQNKKAILAVEEFCSQKGLSPQIRNELIQLLEEELQHRAGTDTIYIHPRPNDSAMFFGEHFTLSAKKLTDYVRSGFKAAIETLAQYEFADHQNKPVVMKSNVT